MHFYKKRCAVTGVGCLLLSAAAWGQAPPATTPAPAAPAPAAPAPLSTPSMTGPLSNLPPAVFDAGPFGKLDVNGIISGTGLAQSNAVPGDVSHTAALSNGQIFLQKADGVVQFYIEAGAYTLPALATGTLQTDKTVSDFFTPLPVAFLKLQTGKNTSIEVGSLPTLIGAEYTFTFENMNIERGLLWNQENAVNKGIQLNQTMGKFTASVSWNDGFYSNRYTWLSGSLAYTNGAHALSFVAGGNYGQTKFQTLAVPVQNNSSIYNLIYTYTKGAWILQPYYQYSKVPTNTGIGIAQGASTNGGAFLISRALPKNFFLTGRFEYISSSGGANAVNLLFGPGSAGTSLTVTPTYQKGGFFARGELSWVRARDWSRGYGFGRLGNDDSQTRVMGEIGFIFGNNISK